MNQRNFKITKLCLGTGDCIALESSSLTFTFKDCMDKNNYVCQSLQTPNPLKVEIIRWPDFVLPLDNVTETSTESNVGFSDTVVFQTELLRPAFFSGEIVSYFTTSDISTISTKQGLSVGMWIRPYELAGKNRFFFDLVLVEGLQHLKLSVKLGVLSATVITDDTTSGVTMLDSHGKITVGAWNFIGFTYCVELKTGTFFINDTYGFKDKESQFFPLTNWFQEPGAELKSLVVGADPSENSAFLGEISCIQIFGKYLLPAQMNKVSKTCHVPETYVRPKQCPLGYTLIDKSCYKLMLDSKTYAEAEVSCTSDANDPFEGRIAFPDNFQVLENLAFTANSKFGTEILVGLDALSGTISSID